jgi:hypothetical protein
LSILKQEQISMPITPLSSNAGNLQQLDLQISIYWRAGNTPIAQAKKWRSPYW